MTGSYDKHIFKKYVKKEPNHFPKMLHHIKFAHIFCLFFFIGLFVSLLLCFGSFLNIMDKSPLLDNVLCKLSSFPSLDASF